MGSGTQDYCLVSAIKLLQVSGGVTQRQQLLKEKPDFYRIEHVLHTKRVQGLPEHAGFVPDPRTS